VSGKLSAEKSQIAPGELFYPELGNNIQKIQAVSGISETLMRKFPLSGAHYLINYLDGLI
jgi:hypothetical protein